MPLPVLYGLAGLALGLAVGLWVSVDLPAAWSAYAAVLALALLSSFVGAARAQREGRFDLRAFAGGLFVNGLLALGLTALGNWLDAPLDLAAVVCFGVRILRDGQKILLYKLPNAPQKQAHND